MNSYNGDNLFAMLLPLADTEDLEGLGAVRLICKPDAGFLGL